MITATLEISLRLHGVRSLKEKRSPRRMLLDRVRSRFKVAAAEVGDQDTLDLLTLGFAAVGPARVPVERVLQGVGDFIADSGEGEIIAERLEFYRG